jgi:hypothetical protein
MRLNIFRCKNKSAKYVIVHHNNSIPTVPKFFVDFEREPKIFGNCVQYLERQNHVWFWQPSRKKKR